MMIVKMIVIFAVITVLLFFAGENSETLQIHFGPYETIPAPTYLLIMFAMLSGMIIAMVISFFDKWKMRADLRKVKKEKKRIEGELNSLRKMPIVESPPADLPEGNPPEPTKGAAT